MNQINQTMAQRVHEYHVTKQEFQALQALVALPRFNVDHYPEILQRMTKLSESLKDEADALWELGINVY